MKDDRLHIQIERYFEGELSAGEERELLMQLLSHPGGDEEIEEALAVMGYVRCSGATRSRRAGSPTSRRGFGLLRRVAGAAAAVAVLTVCATLAVRLADSGSLSRHEGMCVAYVQGVRVDSEQEVMRLIGEQLGEMSEASEAVSREVTGDLDDIFKALNSEEI